MKNKRKLQIFIPALICIVALGLFLIKNHEENREPQSSGETTALEDVSQEDLFYASDISMENLISYGFPIVIDFGSPSCGWCVKMLPDLEKMYTQYGGRATIRNVDISKYPEQAGDYPVNAIPAQFFFNANGTPFTPSEELQEKIEFAFYEDKSTGKELTGHVGALMEPDLRAILDEMVGSYE